MFSSNSLDRNCVGSDPGRNNATRFPVGVTSLGNENQQFRIQLAVHKYNSSSNSQIINKNTVVSPVRHSFLKNSLKAKNFEGDGERSLKNDKRNGNKYEGVGAFPTIHLRKSAVRYRPIKRFNDVKIPYPELPVNRFLSNLPEVNSELKSSARSVLDVLEDLSGKKIHLNDEKSKLKGLGGDYLTNPNAVYKPLFVQKPKVDSILTRDNTTQTLSPADAEASSPQSKNSIIRNDSSDPRAELRRKLAKQNNEIYASLSSSISSSFAIKRKIDKVIPFKDDDESITQASATKKSKTNHQYNNHSDTITTPKSIIKPTDSVKSRKIKSNEANSTTSPNKDRLTTIFLETRNTSPKAQIFEKNTSTKTSKSVENGVVKEADITNGTENGVKDASENEKKNENVESSKPMFNFPPSKANDVKTTTTGFQFGSNFNFKLQNDTESSKSDFSNFKFGTGNSTDQSKKDVVTTTTSGMPLCSFGATTSSVTPQFNFGTTTTPSLSTRVGFSLPTTQTITSPPKPMFTFGQTPESGKNEEKAKTPVSVATTTTTQSIQSSLFSFGQKSEETTPTTVTSSPATTTISLAPNQSDKSLFSSEQKTESPATTSAPVATTQEQKFGFSFGQTSDKQSGGFEQKSGFFFGQKTTAQEAAQTTTTTTATTVMSPSQPPTTTQLALFGQNVTTFGSSPQFGAKSEAPTTQSSTDKLHFAPSGGGFGTATTESSIGCGTTTSIASGFKFESTTTTQSALPFGVSSVTTQTTPAFGVSSATTQSTPTFGVSSITTQTTPAFGASSATTQSTPTFGVSSATTQSTPTFGVSSATTQSTPTFGVSSATTQSTPTFGVSSATTQTTPAFVVSSATTQSAPTFGVSSASQTLPVFGASSIAQSITGFGTSSATQSSGGFGARASNSASNAASAFGVSRPGAFTFGVSTTTQTTPTFGTSTTQSTPAFGSSSTSTPSFEIPLPAQTTSAFGGSSTALSTTGFGGTSTTQSTAFGGSSGFGASSSQPNTAFGAPVSTQSSLQFGAPAAQQNTSFGSTGFSTASSSTFGASTATSTSGFGASQSTFSQPFGGKPPATSSSIFGQAPVPSFSSNNFSSNQNNVFGQKPGGSIFDQSKAQPTGFGAAAQQPFGAQNKFSFGISTSNATGFTSSPLNTTTAHVFSFGGNTTGNTFTFGSNTSQGAANTQTPFAFKSPSNEPFKFGSSATKEGPGFGETSTSTFTFSGQMNNSAIPEQKPAFNFGNPQVSSSPFNFGTTPSPSVFSFGGSTSSASSGASFNFGSFNPGGPFGQPSASPGAPFAVPGTFSIGSGSTQSRPRATSRPRRRP